MFGWKKDKAKPEASSSGSAAVMRASGVEQLLLNEAFHEPLQCIFIAIPKTGTTSIRNQLRQIGTFLIPNPHLTVLQVRDSIYPYYLRRNLGKNSTFPTRDIATDAAIREHARQSFQSFFKFSLVRNPWARAVSLYFRREGEPSSRKMDFEQFCEQHCYASDTCVHPTRLRHQSDWLVDESDHCLMDYVGKLESMGDAVREIRERTDGRICLHLEHSNKNPQSKAESYRDLYTDRSRKMILEHFEQDIERFKYSF
jgi:hypothetical protein